MADTRGIRAGRAFVELGVSDKLSAGLRRAQKRLKAFGDGLRSVGTRLTAIGAGSVASLLSTVKVFTAMGDTLDKMSKRTGASVSSGLYANWNVKPDTGSSMICSRMAQMRPLGFVAMLAP